MKSIRKPLLAVLSISALAVVAPQSGVAQEVTGEDYSREDYWDDHWSWYDTEYRPFFERYYDRGTLSEQQDHRRGTPGYVYNPGSYAPPESNPYMTIPGTGFEQRMTPRYRSYPYYFRNYAPHRDDLRKEAFRGDWY